MSAPTPEVFDLLPDRLSAAKHAYTTRHIDTTTATGLLSAGTPDSGDLVLAEVGEIGQHKKLERCDGRRSTLYPGDEVVVCYGNRYAPDQFRAAVPEDLGPCELVAAGGVAGRVEVAHANMAPATTLLPVGLLLDAGGRRLNLCQVIRDEPQWPAEDEPPVMVAVAGASMNSGKTTSAAHLVQGLRRAGLRVGAAKVTGTGAGGDVWVLEDAGAWPVYDFTFAGVPSTYRIGHDEVCRIFTELTTRLASYGCQVIVVEVADGIYQEETSALLVDPRFRRAVDGVLFACSDALGASAGGRWLAEQDLPLLALTGILTSSPLATAEAEHVTGLPVWDMPRLADPGLAADLHSNLRASRIRAVEQPTPARRRGRVA